MGPCKVAASISPIFIPAEYRWAMTPGFALPPFTRGQLTGNPKEYPPTRTIDSEASTRGALVASNRQAESTPMAMFRDVIWVSPWDFLVEVIWSLNVAVISSLSSCRRGSGENRPFHCLHRCFRYHFHDLETQRVLSVDGYRVNAATEHGAPEEPCPTTI